MEFLRKLRILNANALKFLAAAFMLVDHIGYLFFPFENIWRIIGRLSMPLFAFAISEGCRYTKNKLKHVALLAGLAVICQIVYYLFDNSLYMCILVTFTFSVVTIYAMQNLKKQIFGNAKWWKTLIAALLFVGAIVVTYLFCYYFEVDYGFWGCMLPVFASLFDFRKVAGETPPTVIRRLDCLPLRVLCMGIGIVLLAMHSHWRLSWYALFAIVILLFYNGEKGKLKTKYFFYLFYPLHLVLLEGIYMLL